MFIIQCEFIHGVYSSFEFVQGVYNSVSVMSSVLTKIIIEVPPHMPLKSCARERLPYMPLPLTNSILKSPAMYA